MSGDKQGEFFMWILGISLSLLVVFLQSMVKKAQDVQ